MRFASQADLDRWDASEARRAWRTPPDGGGRRSRLPSAEGLEAWFSLPATAVNHSPVRWKMAALTWLGIFPTVSLLLHVVAPLLSALPFLVRTAVITALAVLMMTWLVMPHLVRLFKPWLTRTNMN
jgi:antibiotic biosynthesis monooxygenase (ABM) superfamily enzyme